MALARQIMGGLAAALSTLPDAAQVEARMNINPDTPCIDIYPYVDGLEEQEERGFGDGATGALLFTVRARVPVVDYDAGQDLLVDWMDPTNDAGVAALLEADQTLGGLASSVDVSPVSGYVSFLDVNGQIARLGAQWRVRVVPAP